MTTPVRALVFDFDGVLVDTESVSLRAWRAVLGELGVDLPIELWHTIAGTQTSRATLLAYVGQRVGPHDADGLLAEWWQRYLALLEPVGPRTGVLAYLAEAARLRLSCAVASSATGDWVEAQLRRVGLWGRFDVVSTGDHHRPKPKPDVYLAALAGLGVDAAGAVAFEDSPPGIAAAKAAGLWCVAVPTEGTATLPLRDADVVIPEFTARPLVDVLRALPR